MRELFRAHARSLAWTICIAASIAPIVGEAAVGRTPSNATVSPTGEASYSIPIFAPPGTHGMTPQMALVYGHRNGGTLVGAGWSIAGLSAITRCPRIWAADGEARDVRNDSSDRFCLDGNRLRLTAGTYGQPNATYQTEIETFSRIRSYGTAGNGPAYFIVEAKDGLIYEYGNTENSRIESVGQPTARTWALNKIRDRSENAILFTYDEDTTNGAYRIDLIEYTSNPGQSLAPSYEIDFVWEMKPSNEIDSGYIAGSIVKEITRLNRIDVRYGSTTVRRYELTYESALSTTSKSRLASLQECAGDPLECFPATTFDYQNGAPGLNQQVNTGYSVPTTPWPLDVNGDGRDDLVYSSSSTSGSGTWMVMLANTSGGFDSPINTGITNTNFAGAITIDYNADGLEDLLVPYSGSTWWVMLGSASGLGSPSNTGAPVTSTGSGINARALDVNGDGLEDLVWADLVGYAGGDAIRYRLREWGGAFASAATDLVGPLAADLMISNGVFAPAGQPGPHRVPDFNGDGRGDILYRRTRRVWIDGPNVWQYSYSLQTVCPGGPAIALPDINASMTPPYFGDFNGDGKSDLAYYDNSSLIRIRLSTGTTFSAPLSGGSLGSYGTGWVVLDWDGDGYDDLLTPLSGVWHLRRSTGENVTSPVSTGVGSGTLPTVSDINGDGLLDVAGSTSGTWRYSLHSGVYPDLLQTATDGFGNDITFTYAPLTSANYSKYSDATFPEQDYRGSLHVVNNYQASNGIGGSYTTTFHYYGARVHLQGRGFEGFYAKRSRDSRNSLYAYDYYERLFPYTGALSRRDLRQSNNSTFIVRTQNTWASHSYSGPVANETRRLPYVSESVDRRYEFGGSFNGDLISTSTTANSVHAATGAVYDSTTTTTEATSANGVQAAASYVQRVQQPTGDLLNDTANWCIGRPGRIESTNSHTQYGGAAITRTTTIDWDGADCRPTEIVDEPGSALQATRSLAYDGFGNLNAETVTGAGMPARSTSVNWGAKGQFPMTVTNALSQSASLQWDYALGLQTRETDPNGIAVQWTYDPFGRRTRESRPDGTATTWAYEDCTSYGCLNSNNKMVVTETALAGTSVITDQRIYADKFDRPIALRARTLSGAYNHIVREYDALGRVLREGAPCWVGCTPAWTTFTHDALNRVTEVSRPVSDSDPSLQITSAFYEGLTTRTVDAQLKQSTKVANVLGGMARSIDHDGYHQSFDYDAFGNVVQVTDSFNTTLLTNAYNIRGMRTGQTDLTAGSWTYVPNALGEIVSQTDGKSQTTTFAYDALGRLRTRAEPEGTSTFTFGTSATAHNIGQLASMSGPGYSESFAYDGIGRLQTRTINSDATYTINYAYNSLGVLDTLTYPTSTSGYRLKLQYEYQNGLLLRVKDFNATSTEYWTANSTDARGNVIDEVLGNGVQTIRGYDQVTGWIDYIQSSSPSAGAIQNLNYSWDRVGNLRQRQDARQGLTEIFDYDNLHRLTSATGPDPFTIGYDARGNITSRSGGAVSGDSHTITWYSYNLPNTISGAGSNSSQFFYAPDRSRYKQVASYAGTSEQTIYIGGLVEKVTRGAEISWKHYIAGGTGIAAIYTRKSTGTNVVNYVTQDHLGSIDSVTTSAGALKVRLSFGAWGERRNEDTWSGPPTSGDWAQIDETSRRGFTSHEMLDNLNLTHMNGRVYDQVIGRFTSPDPFIDGAFGVHGLNRYSYVGNGPLRSVDPSGFTSTVKSWIDAPRVAAMLDFYSDVRANPPAEFSGGGGGRRGGGGDGDDGPTDGDEPATPPNDQPGDCQRPLPPSPDPVNHSEAETAAILQQARAQGLMDIYTNHSGSGKFDFITNDYSDDRFTVNGAQYNASQFGNFLAGYSGAYALSFPGYLSARAFGIVYDGFQKGADTDLDRGSTPYIQDGAAIGQLHRDMQIPANTGCGGGR